MRVRLAMRDPLADEMSRNSISCVVPHSGYLPEIDPIWSQIVLAILSNDERLTPVGREKS